MKGSYILLIFLPNETRIRIGSLGLLTFPKGYSLYVGSAMGHNSSTSLENRVKRHISESHHKKLFWHIDYFLASDITVMIKLYLIPSLIRLECVLAGEILSICDNSIKGFGSSDCFCSSHLLYFKNFQKIKRIFNR
ncbi:MAG: GIY-YIG nuclease family protein [Candidatus Lokiarchaeota archaeon]|nr:GIY-YIG nuclease family protein [Candidatus Lokiarchaeota archaeon]